MGKGGQGKELGKQRGRRRGEAEEEETRRLPVVVEGVCIRQGPCVGGKWMGQVGQGRRGGEQRCVQATFTLMHPPAPTSTLDAQAN